MVAPCSSAQQASEYGMHANVPAHPLQPQARQEKVGRRLYQLRAYGSSSTSRIQTAQIPCLRSWQSTLVLWNGMCDADMQVQHTGLLMQAKQDR